MFSTKAFRWWSRSASCPANPPVSTRNRKLKKDRDDQIGTKFKSVHHSVESELSSLFSFPNCSVEKDRHTKFNTFETKKPFMLPMNISLIVSIISRKTTLRLRPGARKVLELEPADPESSQKKQQQQTLGHFPHPLVLVESENMKI